MIGRILIVEDDEAIATGLALNLKLAGRATTIARDGEQALEQISDEDFALVLLCSSRRSNRSARARSPRR